MNHRVPQLRCKGKVQWRRGSRGFSLIELLVVMAIMVVISSVVLSRYSQFNGVILLRNLAYDVALTIREAQVYGVSGRSLGGVLGVRYGVYFTASAPNQYILFGDSNNNSLYDAGESIKIYTMRPGYGLQNLCAHRSGDLALKCANAGDFTSLTIMFRRPDPDAIVKTSVSAETYTDAIITVVSATGETRTITVTQTGQIAVQQSG